MRALAWCSILSLGLSLGCGSDPQPAGPAELGGSCELDADCQASLRCIEATCVDDSGPSLSFAFPDPLEAVAFGEGIFAYVHVEDRQAGENVEFTFDPFGPTPATTILDWTDTAYENDNGLSLDTPEVPGGHWLRARALDVDGEPYENPSATQYTMVFVRDDVHPNKPMLAVLEPRPDRRHPVGTELRYELAVLPGSFAFSDYGEACAPLPDCADPFAPECEDECGPLSRSGSVKVYLDEDLPGCVTQEPSCVYNYVGSYTEQVDAFVVRGQVDESLAEAGTHQFAAMLVYVHDPYPTASAPIFVSQPLEVVSEP